MSALLVTLLGAALIALIVWWFWLSKPRAAQAGGEGPIEVLVEGGSYSPARIEVPAGRQVMLRFLRKDPSPCAEMVLFDDFGISQPLPLDRPQALTLPPAEPGEYEFTCQMRMYRGQLVVK